jgi:hypothetical protein
MTIIIDQILAGKAVELALKGVGGGWKAFTSQPDSFGRLLVLLHADFGDECALDLDVFYSWRNRTELRAAFDRVLRGDVFPGSRSFDDLAGVIEPRLLRTRAEARGALADRIARAAIGAAPIVVEGGDEATRRLAQGQARLEALQTGGDSYCYVMLYGFDLEAGVARQFVVIREGDFPLSDVRIRIRDLDTNMDLREEQWGEVNAPADFAPLRWSLSDSVYYRIYFFARNGSWNQDLQLHKSTRAQCWLAATRVLGTNGRDIRLEHSDHGFANEFGQPDWRC